MGQERASRGGGEVGRGRRRETGKGDLKGGLREESPVALHCRGEGRAGGPGVAAPLSRANNEHPLHQRSAPRQARQASRQMDARLWLACHAMGRKRTAPNCYGSAWSYITSQGVRVIFFDHIYQRTLVVCSFYFAALSPFPLILCPQINRSQEVYCPSCHATHNAAETHTINTCEINVTRRQC